MDQRYTQEEREVLTALAQKTIAYLKTLPQPITRVCGPLTSGNYEENAKRLVEAEEILEKKGYTILRFGDAELSIKGKEYTHAAIMDLYHKPVFQSGLLHEVFFIKGWEASRGATIEREICEADPTIIVREFPEEWFDKK